MSVYLDIDLNTPRFIFIYLFCFCLGKKKKKDVYFAARGGEGGEGGGVYIVLSNDGVGRSGLFHGGGGGGGGGGGMVAVMVMVMVVGWGETCLMVLYISFIHSVIILVVLSLKRRSCVLK